MPAGVISHLLSRFTIFRFTDIKSHKKKVSRFTGAHPGFFMDMDKGKASLYTTLLCAIY